MNHRRCPEWLTQWEYAHRGLHSEGVPENSLGAARAAIEGGLGIECDVQRTVDGDLMVFHDWELDRLTESTGPIGHRSRADIELMTLVGSDESVPSLAAFLLEVGGAVPVLIEIKSKLGYDVEPSCVGFAEELQSYSGEYGVMSFDPRVGQWFRQNAPGILCGLVMREDGAGDTQTTEARETALEQANPDFLAYHIAALPNPWVEGLRARGLPVLTWTVNSQEARTTALRHTDALIAEGEGLA